jgi:hypothetical protein
MRANAFTGGVRGYPNAPPENLRAAVFRQTISRPSRNVGAAMAEPGSEVRFWRATTVLLAILLALVAAHDVDHFVHDERIGGLGAGVWGFLPLQYGALIATLVLVARGHRLAPPVAAALAAVSLVIFIGAHLLPFGSLSYWDGDQLAITWALIFVPMTVAAALLATALRWRYAAGAVARRQGRVSGSGVSTGSRRSRSGS